MHPDCPGRRVRRRAGEEPGVPERVDPADGQGGGGHARAGGVLPEQDPVGKPKEQYNNITKLYITGHNALYCIVCIITGFL